LHELLLRSCSASNPEIKQRMLDMTAHYQAKADEDEDAEQERDATRARA
jgi:hypothetical protein